MEEMKQSADGTYIVKSKKKVNILAFIGCFVLAFIIWIYVMNVKLYDNTKTFSIKMWLFAAKNSCISLSFVL